MQRQEGTTRKEFLLRLAGAAVAPTINSLAQPNQGPKVLIVVAHPDDEYACAATVYRITHELGGIVDQLVLTNGEGGFRYSRLAEAYYGLPLTQERVGRAKLPAIRKEETLRAGRILGIRQHWFLQQKDARFTLDGEEAFSGIWGVDTIREKIAGLCQSERYDFVVGLLPTAETHGHHQAATLLAVQAVSSLPPSQRPTVIGAEASDDQPAAAFTERPGFALKTVANAPVYQVNRLDSFGPAGSMNYSIIVNWVIAEHKSQGLFQTECGKHSRENFWVIETQTPDALQRAAALFGQLAKPAFTTAH